MSYLFHDGNKDANSSVVLEDDLALKVFEMLGRQLNITGGKLNASEVLNLDHLWDIVSDETFEEELLNPDFEIEDHHLRPVKISELIDLAQSAEGGVIFYEKLKKK